MKRKKSQIKRLLNIALYRSLYRLATFERRIDGVPSFVAFYRINQQSHTRCAYSLTRCRFDRLNWLLCCECSASIGQRERYVSARIKETGRERARTSHAAQHCVVEHEKWTNKNEQEETESKRSRIRHFVRMLHTRVCLRANAVSFARPHLAGVRHVCPIRFASISTFTASTVSTRRWRRRRRRHQLYAVRAQQNDNTKEKLEVCISDGYTSAQAHVWIVYMAPPTFYGRWMNIVQFERCEWK